MTKKNRLWMGGIMAAGGLLPAVAGYYYATQLVRIPEYRTPLLENLMGVCFLGGGAIAAIGFLILLTTRR